MKSSIKYIKTFFKQLGKPKVLFIWIPKNAGTSIYEELRKTNNLVRYLNLDDARKEFTNKGAVTFGHMNVYGLHEEGVISDSFMNEATKFCVSRNPYDRFVSLYYYMIKHDRMPQGYKMIDLATNILNGIPPVGLYNFEGLSQCNKQSDWIRNIQIDIIMKFESLENDLKELEKYLINPVGLVHMNKSTHRMDYNLELDKATISLINEIYEEDFKRFGYSMM